MRNLMPIQNSKFYLMAVEYDRHLFCVGEDKFEIVS